MWLFITDQVLGEDHRHLEGPEFSLIDHLFSVFFVTSLFHCFHDSMHWTDACSIPLFICYHVWIFICYIVMMLITIAIIYLVHVTLGLACIRGVFSSRIYVADSRHDSVSMYFGKWGVTLLRSDCRV